MNAAGIVGPIPNVDSLFVGESIAGEEKLVESVVPRAVSVIVVWDLVVGELLVVVRLVVWVSVSG